MNKMREYDPQKRPLRMEKSSEMPIYTDFHIIEWE